MTSNPRFKMKVLVLFSAILILLSGCSMNNKQKSNFKEDALDILETLEICIENFGFPEDAKLELDKFFYTNYKENTKKIKKG